MVQGCPSGPSESEHDTNNVVMHVEILETVKRRDVIVQRCNIQIVKIECLYTLLYLDILKF